MIGETKYSVEVVRGHAVLEQHVSAWRRLALRAAEPNPFYEPFFLMPALRSLSAGDVAVMLVWADDGAEEELVGLLPLARSAVNSYLPIQSWTPWKHEYCFLTSPLIHSMHVDSVLHAMLGWFVHSGPLSQMAVVGGGALDAALGRTAANMALSTPLADSRTRALLVPDASADAYLNRAISGKHRKEFRRLAGRMAESGNIELRRLKSADLEEWTEQFLSLEASGWKGDQGTAFLSTERSTAFFREVMREGFASGRVMGLALYRDGQPLAMKVNLVSGGGSFAFKISYDEAFAKYSPGVLLEIENIRELHRLGFDWMDSCADEGHQMIERLWPERREIRTLFLGQAGAGSLVLAPSLAALRRWKHQAEKKLAGEPAGTSVARMRRLRAAAAGEVA